MIDLSAADLGDIATALADQSPEHRWLIDPATGAVSLWRQQLSGPMMPPQRRS
jgi:hypothetical protein